MRSTPRHAAASEAVLLGVDTPVVTTVHEDQAVAVDEIPAAGHDVRLDLRPR